MKKNNSAIIQMLMGERGNINRLPFGEEYGKALNALVDKIEELKKQLKDSPKLLKLFEEVLDASGLENTIHVEEVFREAFAFGLAMGQEVFDK